MAVVHSDLLAAVSALASPQWLIPRLAAAALSDRCLDLLLQSHALHVRVKSAEDGHASQNLRSAEGSLAWIPRLLQLRARHTSSYQDEPQRYGFIRIKFLGEHTDMTCKRNVLLPLPSGSTR